MNTFLIICIVIILIFIVYSLNYPVEPYTNRTPEERAIIGPDCSIAKQIPNPGQLGVSGGGNIGAMIRNIRALTTYTNVLVSSPSFGCNFFVQSGMCDNTSVKPCRGKPRFIYHQGIPNPNSRCLQNIGINAGNGRNGGLIPGMIKNVGAIVKTPVGIVKALKGGNDTEAPTISNKCILKSELVGKAPNLSPEVACVPEYNNLNQQDC